MANKKQRKQKKNERRLRQEQSRPKGSGTRRSLPWAGQAPWKPVPMKLYRVPSVLPDSLPHEERVALIQSMAQAAEDEFQRNYSSLGTWLQEYDALHLLAYCCNYFLSHPAGVDPEVSGRLDFYPHYLEILQAFSLMQERSLSESPLGPDAGRLLDLMSNIGQASIIRGFKANIDQIEGESEWNFLLSNMRTQTMAVRNPGYPHHMRKIARNLAERIRIDFAGICEVDPVRLFDALFHLTETAVNRLNDHRKRVAHFCGENSYQAVANSYVESFPHVGEFDANELFNLAGRSLHSMKAMLMYHSDMSLEDCFTFDLNDVVEAFGQPVDRRAVKTVIDKLALEFGDLGDFNKEQVILDNPVWKKPFIKVDYETYFLALAGHIPHYVLGLLEYLVSGDPALDRKYRERKARYLEDEVERLFRAGFPSGKIYRGSMWEDGAGGAGENDLTMVLGSVAIVVEAKSGSLTPPAQRGAPKRLVDTVRQLIVEPADQAYRFIRVLKGVEGPQSFVTKSKAENIVDVSEVRYFLPLTVTMEQFGVVSNLRSLADSGFSDREASRLAQVFSLTDLMVIFEVLDLQSEKVHYLFRRRELGTRLWLHGYEMDLLAFYLDRGFNIGEVEFSSDSFVDLTLMSKQLDPYFGGQQLGVAVDKPALKLTPWWTKMLQRLDREPSRNRLDAALLLLNVPYDDQEKIERQFAKLSNRVQRKKGEEPSTWVQYLTVPTERQFCIGFYPYFSGYREKRDEVIADFLGRDDAQETRGAVCVGVNLDQVEAPYNVVALTPEPDLFDQL